MTKLALGFGSFLILLQGCSKEVISAANDPPRRIVERSTRVRMENSPEGPVFRFTSCEDEPRPISFRSWFVEEWPNDEVRLICSASDRRPGLSEWTYGQEPVGIGRFDCKPLTPGQTYILWVSEGAPKGRVVFKFLTGNQAEVIEASCSD